MLKKKIDFQKNQGYSINVIVFPSLKDLDLQLERARRDRGESHMQKIFLKTPENRQAEW
ncbi:hypothetical protein DPMN_024661 [Dreissena polymorpha]|uniref:Uncharacterized protein n=1 Tax=Dreissena polymorpha TaxID=45954 RepID=A0A9D4LMX9_DREPO|nr:hypothetical protein DPMN_024661 [Dreissena polymorpha]